MFTELKKKKDAEKEQAYKDFLKFTTVALSSQAHKRVKEFIQFPLSSVWVSRGLISDLYKVFNAGNSFFNVQTVKNNGGDKLQTLLEELNLNKWIEDTGKGVLKNKPNTVVVVDKNEEGKPYLIAVDNDRLVDYKFKEDGKTFDYITFIHSKEKNEKDEEVVRYALYDEESYHVAVKEGSKDIEWESTTPHGLGSVPARMFIDEVLNSDSDFCRYTPLALGITKLKEWQYFDTYKFYTDHYTPFPITEMVRKQCGNQNCKDGFVYHEERIEVNGEIEVKQFSKPCETCKDLNSIGVGAKILLDRQTDKDEATASGKFRFINNDVRNLEYLQNKLKEIEESIKLKVVGADEVLTKEAVNEKQVQGSFESKTNVLLSLKNNLDGLYTWIVQTVAGLYIPNSPISVNANYGTEWYLTGEDELQKRFENAKRNGMPTEEVASIYFQLIETKYKGNPSKLKRAKMINSLNPCPFDSLDEKIKKKNAGALSLADFVLSENILMFISKFESEQGSILEFGANETHKVQVSKIKEIIKNYANEYINSAELVGGGKKTDE